MFYKSLHGLAPDYLRSKFERRETAYNVRDPENKLNVPLPRTNYYKNSFSYSGATLWNSLPCDIRQAESLGLFKRLIKEVRYLLNCIAANFCCIRGLSLLLVLVPAPRVFLRVLRFSSLHKNQHFQIPIRPGNNGGKSHSVDSTEIPIYLFFFLFVPQTM